MHVPEPVWREIVTYINGGGGFNNNPAEKQLALKFMNALTGQNETNWGCQNTQFFAQKIIMECYNNYKNQI